MNARFKQNFWCLCLALAWLCLLPPAARAQTLSASANGLGGLQLVTISVTADSDLGDCSTAGCVRTITDTVTITDGFVCDAGPGAGPIFDIVTVNLFSWFSVTELPGSTFFPKVFAGVTGVLNLPNTAANMWQTTSPVVISPGIVRVQNVWFRAPRGICSTDGAGTLSCDDDNDCLALAPGSICIERTYCADIPQFGPVNFMNALTWSADLSGGAIASADAGISSLSLVSSSNPFGRNAGWEVRLESSVREARSGGYLYEYIFENFSPDTVTVSWDSANLTRTLEPYETVTVLQFSDFGAKESKGYAHVIDVENQPITQLVSMALVPTQPSEPPERPRIRTKPDRLDDDDRR